MCCHFFVIARESVTVGEGEGDASLIGNRCTLNCPHILENSWAIRKALGESEAESKTVCDTLSFHAKPVDFQASRPDYQAWHPESQTLLKQC